MKLLRPIIKLTCFTLQLALDVVILFFLFTLIGAFWGRNTDEVLNKEGIPLYIHGDGFHTELYLPVKDSLNFINWMDWLGDNSIKTKHQHNTLINFAWAEYDWTLAGVEHQPKGIQTTRVMHVQLMNELWPLKHPVTAKRYLSAQQYLQLIAFIKSGFELKDGKPIIRSFKGYYGWDYMFLSNRNYNSFNTCNQFTSDALNACGVRNATFSPFGWGVLYQVKMESH
jgi:uncharacterized protein (TIGR02117 family)